MIAVRIVFVVRMMGAVIRFRRVCSNIVGFFVVKCLLRACGFIVF